MWKRIAETSFSQILIIIIGIINTVILNRMLGPAGKGEYAYILLIASTLAMILEVGFATGISFSLGKKTDIDNNKWKTFSMIISVFWLIIALISIIIIYLHYSNNLKYILIALIFLFQISNKYILGNFLGSANIRNYNIYRVLPITIQLFGLLIILVLKIPFTPETAVIIFLLSTGINYFVSIIPLFPFKWIIPSFKEFKDMISYSFYVYIANMLSFLNYRIDMFLIKFMLPIEYLGWYSVSVFFIEKAKLFANSSSIVNFSYKINLKDRTDTGFNIRLVNTVNVLLALFFIIFGYPLILLLYSRSYSPSYLPVLILAPAIVVNGFGKMLASELSADKIVKFQMLAGLISVIVNVLLNILLIPILSISGAALASLISYSINTIIILYYFLNHYKHFKCKNLYLLKFREIKSILIRIRYFKKGK